MHFCVCSWIFIPRLCETKLYPTLITLKICCIQSISYIMFVFQIRIVWRCHSIKIYCIQFDEVTVWLYCDLPVQRINNGIMFHYQIFNTFGITCSFYIKCLCENYIHNETILNVYLIRVYLASFCKHAHNITMYV